MKRIRIEGEIAYVPLTRGYEAVIDAADVGLVEGHCWYATVHGDMVYARRTSPRGKDGKRTAIGLHRVIIGAPDDKEVDHIDMDGLNNRRSNLRVATRSQNVCNRGVQKNSSSGLKGVHWKKANQKWSAHIKAHGRKKHLGLFTSKEAAYAAYVDANKKLHGEFGRIE